MILINSLLKVPFEGLKRHVYLFTANSTIKTNGELVMGRGIAKAVRDNYPDIAKKFGMKIPFGDRFGLEKIYFQTDIYDEKWEGYRVIPIYAFQTKIDFRTSSPLDLIEYSVSKLKDESETNPDIIYHLPFPGCGNGGRTKEEILPLIQCLPNNVLVYLPY